MSEDLEEFLSVANRYKLGSLTTESSHPLTINLSTEAQSHLPKAVETLKQVDSQALKQFEDYASDIAQLGGAIYDTLTNDGRVFLCGCGATGRLSISLEVFCREGLIDEAYRDRFVGFMAGGDAALIKSIEAFEDHPEYGARQLEELGFGIGDLLISTTEGGETPFVIGATERAAELSDKKPWFLYCNPRKQLVREVERSAKIINDPKINSRSFYVGPMGLSGGTRMQASTVLMAGIGWAIRFGSDLKAITQRIKIFRNAWETLDLEPLSKFTTDEAELYKNREYVIYTTNVFGVTVLTDTTERSPTFSLPAFENQHSDSDMPGWCYLSMEATDDSTSAWHKILKRAPRCLEWDGIKSFTGEEYLYGFYIDSNCEKQRIRKTGKTIQHLFYIRDLEGGFRFEFQDRSWEVSAVTLSSFEINLILKLVLNIHSTLVMGILHRFESNLMTYVKPTNLKLIDRSIRYVQQLAAHRGQPTPACERVAELLFEIRNDISEDEPIVLKILEKLDIS